MSGQQNPGWGCGPIFLVLLGAGVVSFILLSVIFRDRNTLQITAIIGGLFGAYCIGSKGAVLRCAGAIIIALAFATFSSV